MKSDVQKTSFSRTIGGTRGVRFLAGLMALFFWTGTAMGQGSWTALSNGAPNANNGVMLLLSDGRVMCKSNAGGGDGVGNTWNLLTPDANGSYANGTWTTLSAMAKTRLYFSSQVLMDGRVFVCGGEYGTGGNFGEIYDPQTDTWSGETNFGTFISDANSEILPDGKVLVAPVGNRPNTFIWNPADNTFVSGPSNLGNTNESAWVKLPDNSILFIRTLGTQSERYIPSSNTWISDGVVPVALYESLGAETGPAFMLPDGRAFFLGGNSNTAFYTPSGNTTNGTWAAGPNIPASLSAPDAAAAMMVDGHILCAISPTLTRDANGNNIFNTPTSFYTFDYTSNSFTQVNAPAGGLTVNIPSYKTNMVDLPNGQVLYGQQGNSQYYVFSTTGGPLAAGKPAITNIAQNGDGSFTLTGTLLNGITEGAGYGDDWQMNTNYPLVRLTNGSNVYYARTYNWSSTGVFTGGTSQTTGFVLPAGLPPATYSLVVVANGNPSDPVSFCYPRVDATASVTSNYHGRDVSCFNSCDGAATVTAVGGVPPYSYSWSNGATTQSVSGLCAGTYTVTVSSAAGCSDTRSVVIHNTPELLIAPAATSHHNGYNISCFGGNDGTAIAAPSGGTAPYSYLWSDGQTTNAAVNLAAGTYSVTVTDVNGCSKTGSVTLTQPPKLTINAGSNKIVYLGYPDSSCTTLSATGAGGGVPPYTLTWSNGSHASSITVCPTATTDYVVTISDLNGCSVKDTVRVCVIDVRCGNHMDKVVICHNTGSSSNPSNTLCVALPAAMNHIAHGDQLAACGTVKICTDGTPMVRSTKPVTEVLVQNEGYLKAYPNPTTGLTTVSFAVNGSSVAEVKLYDVSGKQVMNLFHGKVDTNKDYEVSVNARSLNKGLYLVKLITSNGELYVEKLVISR